MFRSLAAKAHGSMGLSVVRINHRFIVANVTLRRVAAGRFAITVLGGICGEEVMIAKFVVSATPRARYACCGCRGKSHKSSSGHARGHDWVRIQVLRSPISTGAVVLVGIWPHSFSVKFRSFPQSRRPPLLRIRLDFANGRFSIRPGGSNLSAMRKRSLAAARAQLPLKLPARSHAPKFDLAQIRRVKVALIARMSEFESSKCPTRFGPVAT
jgi:hypothetical protein